MKSSVFVFFVVVPWTMSFSIRDACFRITRSKVILLTGNQTEKNKLSWRKIHTSDTEEKQRES